MSSNHTLMSRSEWNQLQSDVNSGEARITHTKEEIDRIQAQVQAILDQAEAEREAPSRLSGRVVHSAHRYSRRSLPLSLGTGKLRRDLRAAFGQ